MSSRLTACLLRVKLRRTQYEHMFSALPPNSDIARRSRHVSKVPTTEVTRLFDHLVGSRQQRRRNGEAEGLGGLQVYSQFEARGLFDRDIRGLCASQYLVDVGRCAAEKIGEILSVRQQKTVWDHLRDKRQRWQPVCQSR